MKPLSSNITEWASIYCIFWILESRQTKKKQHFRRNELLRPSAFFWKTSHQSNLQVIQNPLHSKMRFMMLVINAAMYWSVQPAAIVPGAGHHWNMMFWEIRVLFLCLSEAFGKSLVPQSHKTLFCGFHRKSCIGLIAAKRLLERKGCALHIPIVSVSTLAPPSVANVWFRAPGN